MMTAPRANRLLGAILALPLLATFGCASSPPPLPMPTAARPCPQWTDFPADVHSNLDSAYLGCTSAINLRAMLADPADLDRGRPLGPADGARAARAVTDWQQGKVRASGGSGAGAGAAQPSAGATQ